MSEPENNQEIDSIEERVVNKLKKVITIKKQLTPKQQAHIDNLANKKKGKKYVEAVSEKDLPVEIPVVIKEKPKRAPRIKPEPISESESSEEVIVVKKPKKKIRYIEQSEESEEIVEIKKKKVVPCQTKPKAKPKAKPIEKVSSPPKSMFNIF